MIRLTKRGFRLWLVRNRKVLVGQSDNNSNCPFCRYLKSLGARRVYIPVVGYRIVDGRMHDHNKWQRDFQNAAIRMEQELDVVGLRGREALQVLDEL